MPERTGVAILTVIAAIGLFAPLGVAPLFDKDEGAFSEATREMLVSGNYVMTYLNGEPRYDKPILIYWLQAISGTIFGLNAFAMRLPSAIASACWALALYRFAKEFLGARRAFWAAFFLLTSLQVTIIAKAAIADALLNLFIALTMFDAYRYSTHGQKRHLYAAYAWAALGVLTKGPIAIAIPFAAFTIVAFVEGRFRFYLRSLVNPIAIAIFLAIVLPWPILAYLDQGPDLIRAWFWDHTFKRVATPLEGHGGNVLYYVPVVLIGLLPFTPFLIQALRPGRALFKESLTLFCVAWFLFVFVLFTFVGTKLPHYVVYGYTPLFLLMSGPAERNGMRPAFVLPTLSLIAILVAVPYVAPALANSMPDAYTATILEATPRALGLAYAAGTMLALIVGCVLLSKRVPASARTVVLGVLVCVLVNFVVMPAAGRLMQAPIRDAALVARDSGFRVVLYEFNMPSFMFYQRQLTERRMPQDSDVVLSKISEFQKLVDEDHIDDYAVLFERHGVVLAQVHRASP